MVISHTHVIPVDVISPVRDFSVTNKPIFSSQSTTLFLEHIDYDFANEPRNERTFYRIYNVTGLVELPFSFFESIFGECIFYSLGNFLKTPRLIKLVRKTVVCERGVIKQQATNWPSSRALCMTQSRV